MLLNCIINDYKENKLKIISKNVFCRKSKRCREVIKKLYFLQYDNGDIRRIGRKEREILQSINKITS